MYTKIINFPRPFVTFNTSPLTPQDLYATYLYVDTCEGWIPYSLQLLGEGMETDESTLDMLQEKATSLLSTLRRSGLGSKHLPKLRVPKAFSQEKKWLERKAYH